MKQKHSHHHFAIIGSMISILFVLVIAVILIYQRLCFVDYTKYHYTESADALSNPYIGWYTIHGYLLAEDATLSLPKTTHTNTKQTNSTDTEPTAVPGLSLLEINLKNYANCDLTDTAVEQIDSILSSWARTGSQLILRFLYDWDGKNLESEPKELSQILTHMEQIGPIVNQYATSVYLLQGIFVGNWGEMNNTTHMGNGEMETLIQKLADVMDPSIFLSVRTPAQWRAIVGKEEVERLLNASEDRDRDTTSQGDRKTATVPVPLGLFNDGMLGSANDTGTYSDAWTREEELAFQNKLCRYVPNGGEVIVDNTYNDFDNAVKDLAQMHVSYLNSDYDTAVLDKWKETIVNQQQTDTDEIFDGMTGYDYIERHLGYRYVLKDSSIQFHPLMDQTATLTVNVENVGFSNCYRPFEVRVQVVCDRTGQCVRTISVDTDPRHWNSEETTEFAVPIDVRELADGEDTNTYTLYLSCKDPALDRSILFANTQDLTAYGYSLGQLTVSKKIN